MGASELEGTVEAIELNLTTVLAIWMGGAVLLVPLTGLTLRFGFAPFVDSLARARMAWSQSASSPPAAERLAAVERRLADLAREVERARAAERPAEREPARV